MNNLIKYILLIWFAHGMCLSQQKVHAQNFVDNWSFEDTVMCPWGLTQIQNSQGWVVNRGTPDYFNECNQGSGTGPQNVNVPQNVIDYQFAKSGVAYSGLLTYSTFVPNVREMMGTILNQPLQIGQMYFVSFYVSRALNHSANYRADVANNKIGVQFTTYSQEPPNVPNLNNISQVYTDSIITDTLNWVQIKGSFVADSNYQYISIGNFFDGASTQFIQYDSLYTVAYYYIDDVCVSPDSLYCDLLSGISQPHQPANDFNQPSISSTLNEITVSSEINIKTCRVYNSLGQIVYDRKGIKEKQATISTIGFSTGIYFVQVRLENEGVYNLKVFRQ